MLFSVPYSSWKSYLIQQFIKRIYTIECLILVHQLYKYTTLIQDVNNAGNGWGEGQGDRVHGDSLLSASFSLVNMTSLLKNPQNLLIKNIITEVSLPDY